MANAYLTDINDAARYAPLLMVDVELPMDPSSALAKLIIEDHTPAALEEFATRLKAKFATIPVGANREEIRVGVVKNRYDEDEFEFVFRGGPNLLKGTIRVMGDPDEVIMFAAIQSRGVSTHAELIEYFKQILIAIGEITDPLPASSGPRDVPRGSSDPVTYEDIEEGDIMVDFNSEFQFRRYYKATTLPMLRGKNPFTSEPITNVVYYTAHIVEPPAGGKRRRRSYRRRLAKRGKTLRR